MLDGIRSPISGMLSPFGQESSWAPSALFTGSALGVWYDPSDLSTMFTDSAGTTPVTAAGDAVGLILDKSQGLALGGELAGAVSVPFTVFRDGVTNTASPTLAAVVAGSTYQVTLTISENNNTISASFRVAGAGANVVGSPGVTSFTGTGQKTWRMTVLASGNLTLNADNAGVNFTVTAVSVKQISGNHAYQATSASRPVYQTASGKHFLLFDGTDDSLATGTITPGTNKVQVFAGVRKLSDAATGTLAEYSDNGTNNAGSFAVFAPVSASANYAFRSRGSGVETSASYTNAAVAAPITTVVTGLGDIAGDRATMRVNGSQVAQSTADQGAGNYLAYPLYIGRRGGTALPYNGRLYGLIVRFGDNLPTATIEQAEDWMNGKTGAY